MAKSKKYAYVHSLCVACGTCLKECKFGAISVKNGIKASVDTDKCVGCSKCSKVCPASVIEMISREVIADEK